MMDKINKIVSSLLGALNGIIAIVMLFITLIASFNMPSFELGLAVFALGLILTIIACGITAVLRDIKSEITTIRKDLAEK
tara:strand:+ start:940 stop:1179 length:240 start_codon:yes stop_codon:yes gene_type:complete